MASFFITSSSTTAQTLNAGENGFIGVNGTLYTETATAVNIGSVGGDHGLNVQGTLATATGVATVRTSNSTSANIDIVVGALGSITSTTTDAIRVSVTQTFDLRNAGLISGDDTAVFVQGVAVGSQTATILNSGTISAVLVGVNSGADITRLDVINEGTMSSRVDAIFAARVLSLANTGDIFGEVEADFADIRNAGTITGQVTGNGSSGGFGSDLVVINSATINGDISGSGGLRVENTGTITGEIDALFGDFAFVLNAGRIGGDVILSTGSDTFINAGGTVAGEIRGYGGNDTFTIDRGDLRIDGGPGTDTVFSTASYKLGGEIEVLNLSGALGLTGIGRDGNETITGGDGNDMLQGRAGNDSLNGNDGDDLVLGGKGDDRFGLSDGTDTLQGGVGTDTVFAQVPDLRAQINLAAGTAVQLFANGEVAATAVLDGIENADGSALADVLTGSNAANLLQGNDGNDTLSGGSGADTLEGDAGLDSLIGGNGDDILRGGMDSDTIAGGGQADTFQFFLVNESAVGAADLITDYSVPNDTIDLFFVDADALADGNQAFAFVGTAAFSGLAAQVRFVQDAGANTTTVQARLANSNVISMEIVLTGLHALTAGEFVL
jgi:hypothetical protein